MDSIINWWQTLETREQSLIALGGAILSVFCAYLLLLAPLTNWHMREQLRVEQLATDLSEVKPLVARIQAQRQSANRTGVSKNLATLVDSSLRANDLTMRGFQPGNNNDARLRLDNASYANLMQWLYDLEYRHGIVVEDLSLNPARSPGRLMVSVRLSQ